MDPSIVFKYAFIAIMIISITMIAFMLFVFIYYRNSISKILDKNKSYLEYENKIEEYGKAVSIVEKISSIVLIILTIFILMLFIFALMTK